MAVRLTEPFSTNWNHVRLNLAQGHVVPSGELANQLLADGAPVEEIPAEPAAGTDDEVPDGGGVPDGTITQVQEWVGDDRQRAALALDAEQAKGDSARSTLVAALEKLLADN